MSNNNDKSADRPKFKGSTVLKEFKQEVNLAIVENYPSVLERAAKDLAKKKLEKFEELLVIAFAKLQEFEDAWKSIKADNNEYDEDGAQIGTDKYSKAVLDQKKSAKKKLVELNEALKVCRALTNESPFDKFESAFNTLGKKVK